MLNLLGCVMTEKKTIDELLFLKAKLYNGIYGNRLGCVDVAIKALGEIQQYWEIGTVEECRESVERRTPAKPIYESDGDADGYPVYDTWICPHCETRYEVDYDDYKCCPECGQAINWSEEK